MSLKYTSPNNKEFSSIVVSGKEKSIVEKTLNNTKVNRDAFKSFNRTLKKAEKL